VDDAAVRDGPADHEESSLGTSLLFDVFALNQAVGRLLADAMRDGPLTPAEYAVYSAIFELEAATPTELAARLDMRLTTFVDRLREIEGRGHARRLPHPTDGRSYRVVLTTPGLAAHRAANAQFERAYTAFEVALARDQASAKAALLEIRDAANRASMALAHLPAAASVAVPMRSPVSPRRSAGRGD
jgi:DNA-binding MarR family transcriptional regulator